MKKIKVTRLDESDITLQWRDDQYHDHQLEIDISAGDIIEIWKKYLEWVTSTASDTSDKEIWKINKKTGAYEYKSREQYNKWWKIRESFIEFATDLPEFRTWCKFIIVKQLKKDNDRDQIKNVEHIVDSNSTRILSHYLNSIVHTHGDDHAKASDLLLRDILKQKIAHTNEPKAAQLIRAHKLELEKTKKLHDHVKSQLDKHKDKISIL